MKMNDKQLSIFRRSILCQLDAAMPNGLPVDTIHQGVRFAGFDKVEQDRVERELETLKLKGFVTFKRDPINRAIKRWSLTGAGIDFLEETGF